MSGKYRAAKWGKGAPQATGIRVDSSYPSLKNVNAFARKLAAAHPDKLTVKTAGRSVGGNDILLVTATDKSASDEDKQIALFMGAEHGEEFSAATALIKTLEWLVVPEAADITRRQKVLIIPCVNPDGYDDPHLRNMNNANLYADYALSGEPTQPESGVVWRVIEENQPEVVGSVHGRWHLNRYAAVENCSGSYGTSRYDRCHSRLFAEEVNKACEEAGYPQDRMEEDEEKILPPLSGFANHAACSGDLITPGVYAYNRFHSLLFSMEVMYDESGLIKIRKILELGNQVWRYEPRPGYPVQVITRPFPFGVVAYGNTAAERRKSRVELWQSNDTLTRFSLPYAENDGFLGVGVSIHAGDSALGAKTAADVLDQFAHDENVNTEALRKAFGPRLAGLPGVMSEPASARPVWLSEIRNGLGLRIRLLPGSRVKRVLVNGREARESGEEGYETWTPKDSFTVAQINIPPGKSMAAPNGKLTRVLCTVEYEPGQVGRL